MKDACVKYVFFDIDGTIAKNNEPPSEAVTQAIRSLRRNGHRAFVCTARTMCDVYGSLLSVGFDGIIAGAGAHVIVGKKEIFHHYISEPLLLQTVSGIYRYNFSGVLEGTDNIYLVPGEVELPEGWPILGGIQEVSRKLQIEKFTIHTYNHAHIDQIVKQMPELLEHYELYKNNSGSFGEFICKGINKALGIKKVMEFFGEDIKNAVAFGDSMNDAPAIQEAGIGVAMGNSPIELKEMAQFVTGTLEEDGVVSGLKFLGLI